MNNRKAHNPIEAAESQPDPAGSLTPKELQFRIGVYETYLLLRDGVNASPDQRVKLAALESYIESFQRARQSNTTRLKAAPSSNCKKFFNLYDSIGMQMVFYFGQFLRNPNLPATARSEIQARLYSLKLFEEALMSLVIIHAEGGRSDLDPDVRQTCVAAVDRTSWSTILLRAHQSLEKLHSDVFGIASAMSPISETSLMSDLNHRFAAKHKAASVVYFMGELAASIIAWDKAYSPVLKKIVASITVSPWGKVASLVGGAVYAIGWVAFDRFVHRHVPILRSSDFDIREITTLSSWERLMDMGHELVRSDLNSPPLYYGYLKLLSLMEHQRTYNFLTENQWVLAWAEQHYGSVDAALKKLKEVFRHENPDHGLALDGHGQRTGS